MGLIKIRVEGHMRVLDMISDEALEAMGADFFFIGVANRARPAVGRFHSRARRGEARLDALVMRARFLADRPGRAADAVRVAETAIAERRDIFTADALAWAYFKAGRTADASLAIGRALRTGTLDAHIRCHAAVIAEARRTGATKSRCRVPSRSSSRSAAIRRPFAALSRRTPRFTSPTRLASSSSAATSRASSPSPSSVARASR